MAVSSLDILSGISAAVAGFAGDKVSKTGKIPGLDLAALVPALLGKNAEGTAGLVGSLASLAGKAGLLNSSNLEGLVEMAASLFSVGKTTAAKKTADSGIAGLAAAIMGNSGKAANLVSIASMASGLAGSVKSEKEVTGIASSLAKTLSGSFGLSFNGGASAIKALGTVVDDDTKSGLLTAVLKGLA